jgi:DNA-binding NarL/FixJ family response regulator
MPRPGQAAERHEEVADPANRERHPPSFPRGSVIATAGDSSMNAFQPAAILIVDAQVLFRAGLQAKLAPDSGLSVVGEADDGESALTAVMTATPDIVLIDANLPMPGGLEVAAQIRRVVSTAAIIVLTERETDDELFRAIKVGSAAYLRKTIETADLLSTIGQVARGEYPINEASSRAARSLARSSASSGRVGLWPPGAVDLRPVVAPRGPDPRGHHERLDQPADRARAEHLGADRQEPRVEHPAQALSQRPDASGRLRDPQGLDRGASS